MKKATLTFLMLVAFSYLYHANSKDMVNIQEVWKDVVGYELYYEVSSLGPVRSKDRHIIYKRGGIVFRPARLLKLVSPKGYTRVTLTNSFSKTKIWFVHRLVAIAFISDNPDGKPFVNHKNFIRDDNRPENLEWVDSFENMAHQVNAGRSLKGSKNPSAILTDDQVREIKRSKSSFKEMSEKYGVCRGPLEALRYGRTWKHIKNEDTV